MGYKNILVLTLLLLTLENVLCKVWQFGRDAPNSEVLYHGSGKISASEKIKQVQMTIPECYNVKLLRVEVQNFLSHANTTFNEDTNVVTISYKPWQFSESTYDISAKAVKDPECILPDEEDIQPVNHPELSQPLSHVFSEHL